MRFFLQTTCLTLKLVFSPALLILALAFPLAVVGASALIGAMDKPGIRIGLIILRDPSENGAKAERDEMDYLTAGLGNEANIVPYTPEESDVMKGDVARRYLDCAYVVDAVRIGAGDYEDAITLYRAVGTFSDSFARLSLTAAQVREMTGLLGYGVARKSFPDETREDIVEEIQFRADRYLENGLLMTIVKRVTAGGLMGNDAGGAVRVQRGIAALFAVLLAYVCAFSLRGMNAAVAARAGNLGFRRNVTAFGGAAAIFTAQVAFFAVSALFFGINAGEAPVVLLFALSNALFGAALAKKAGEGVFPAIMAFMFVMTALFGGLFFQVREIAPWLAWVQYAFPSYYYMRTVTDNGLYAFGLAAACVISAAAAVRRRA